MNGRTIRAALLLSVTGAACLPWAFGDEPHPTAAVAERPEEATAAGTEDVPRVSVETARDRAKTMHDVYAATLEAMHHHYFRGDRARVPASAMEDVFAEIARQSKIEARWISVNTKAMSIDHEPQTDFEKAAVRSISSGAAHYETVENGFYRRAGAIPLGNGCVSCHVGFFKPNAQRKHFAGLVISVPVRSE